MNSELPNLHSQESITSQLSQYGYLVLRHMLSIDAIARLDSYMLKRWKSGAISSGDKQVPDTPSMYADPVMDKLLEDLWPRVEEASGLRVYPTYSYMRLYKHGDILARHTDREACEVSLSLCVANDPPDCWPLWIDGPHGIASIDLSPGDAVLYRGIDCPHWREKFEGTMAKQVFLHYVDKNGPYRSWRFDKRAHLAHTELLQTTAVKS